MKKFLKIFAIAAIAVAAAIACVFAGCGGGGDDGDSGSADYNFTLVYENGQPVNGQTDGGINGKVATQICLPATEGGMCIILPNADIFPDANGKLSLSQAKVNELFGSDTDVTVFIFHAIGVTGHKNDCEVAVNGKGDYSLTITVS